MGPINGHDMATVAMAGCDGAIAGALMGYLNATLILAIDRIAELADLGR